MREARVLVVDDSAAMRALFCDILDEAKNVQVVGTANNADQAREKIATLRPNVLTLDVEMPGTSGMELLEEIMNEAPMPIVMLSSVTQVGTGTAARALELGAVDCFPKPLHTTPEEFSATVSKLGKIVLAAANTTSEELRNKMANRAQGGGSDGEFAWNGNIVALTGATGGIAALRELLADYPSNGPATIIALPVDKSSAMDFMASAGSSFGCKVRVATDGAALEQGVVLVAFDQGKHVVVEAGTPNRVRMIERDPVGGVRPSADLLFGSIARSGISSVGVILSGHGSDGVKGLTMLRQAGGTTLSQDPSCATIAEAPRAANAANASSESLSISALCTRIRELCSA